MPYECAVGDSIEHRLIPGFRMEVLARQWCEVDANRSEPHWQYRVIVPDGAPDWLCGYMAVGPM